MRGKDLGGAVNTPPSFFRIHLTMRGASEASQTLVLISGGRDEKRGNVLPSFDRSACPEGGASSGISAKYRAFKAFSSLAALISSIVVLV
jgi:hypothetical protein